MLKVASFWRIIREVDLQAIRAQSQAPFDLLVVAESIETAVRFRAFLSPQGIGRSPHPWIRVATPEEAVNGPTPDAAIFIAEPFPVPARIDTSAHSLRRSRVPVVVIIVSSTVDSAAAPHAPDYVVLPQLDADAAAQVARALLPLLPESAWLAFARQLPVFRPPFFDMTIEDTARANASYSLTTGLAEVVPVLTVPLNLGDMVILTKNQLLMAYRLALAAGRNAEPRKLLFELIGVLGGGLLFRQLARQLVGLIPVLGLVPKIAIAYGGTWAIGRGIVLWLTEGRPVTSELVGSLAAAGLERGRAVARDLVARRS